MWCNNSLSFTFSPSLFFVISGIKTWRLSSLMSTWCLITVKNSMKTIQTLVELVITWGSSLRSAGRSFWNKQTRLLFRFSPINPFNFSYRSTRFSFLSLFSWWRMWLCRMEEEEVKPLIRSPWCAEDRCHLEKKKKKVVTWCALDFITTGRKAPKSPRKMGCRSAIPFPVSEHCTELILNFHWCVCARILSTTCK